MYPVASITPEANAFTMTNKFLSGPKAGIARVNIGRHTPIMLATKIEAMAINFSFNDSVLSRQEPMVEFGLHSDGASAPAVERREIIRRREKAKGVENVDMAVVIVFFFLLAFIGSNGCSNDEFEVTENLNWEFFLCKLLLLGRVVLKKEVGRVSPKLGVCQVWPTASLTCDSVHCHSQTLSFTYVCWMTWYADSAILIFYVSESKQDLFSLALSSHDWVFFNNYVAYSSLFYLFVKILDLVISCFYFFLN